VVRRRTRRRRDRRISPASGFEPGFTVEGNLSRLGEFAVAVRRASGRRRVVAYAVIALVLVPLVIGVGLGIAELIGRL
jgi:hypothetical protein